MSSIFNITFFITLLVSALSIFLGFRVYFSNKKLGSHKLYLSLAIEFAFWVLFNYFATHDQSGNNVVFVRLVMVVTAGIPVALYYLAHTFPNHRAKLPKWWKNITYAWVLFIWIFNFLPFTFTQAILVNGDLILTTSWGIVFSAINFLLFCPMAIGVFYRKIIHSKGIEKIRLRYLVIAFTIAVIAATIFNFFLPVVLNNNSYVIIGSWALTTVVIFTIGYSFLKVRFTSIDFLLAKILYYFVLWVWLVIALIFMIHGTRFFGTWNYVAGFIFSIPWLFVFLQIYNHFQNYLIRRIVNQGVDWNIENKKFTAKISKELRLNTILTETLRVTSMLFHNSGNLIYEDFTHDGKFFTISTFDQDPDLARLFSLCQEKWKRRGFVIPIIFEEVELKKDPHNRELLRFMKKHHYAIVYPITLYSGAQGILIIGDKDNQNPYFVQDIQMLDQIIATAATSIERAVVYQNSQNFNDTLQRRVDIATAKLTRVNKKLIIADKMKDEFVSVASHELRTPMTSIKNYLWLVKKYNNAKEFRKNESYINIALNNADRLIEMVNSMLTISRIEGNRFSIHKTKTDLNQLVERIFIDYQSLTQEKKIGFEKKTQKKPIYIDADSERIMQVLQNILGNAIKFTTTGQVKIACFIRDNKAHITIADSGPGIAKEDLPKLFKKFCRLENSYVKIKETGTGLGLYISSQIVALHQGKITVTSKLGHGSTFEVTLPLYQAPK